MSKIIKLDKNLANQIAAGEVVERPLSVVKELVENSIDAGASEIKVEIKEGGIEEIIVSDNGEGIEEDDLKIILDKYTTSKIKNLHDLYNVMTFGFRGEALSSISSVSKFKITSRTMKDNFGTCLESSGGEDRKISEEACEKGTKIIVKNLFFNTPARLNYLKKARTEYAKIKEFLEQISLSYPDLGFEFWNDSRNVFTYRAGEDLKSRIYNIYGEKFASNLLEIKYELSGIKISGYISDPKIAFKDRNRQVLFVNNRIIKSPLIIKSISDAYNRFIPHGEHPAYLLNIEVDPTQVDVNVHPRKLEVRFAEESQIFRGFYHAILDKLNSVSLLSTKTPLSQTFSHSEKGVEQNSEKQYYTGSGTKFKSYSPYKDTNSNPDQSRINDAINFSKSLYDSRQVGQKQEMSGSENIFDKSTDLHDTPVGRIIGQMHNSYIIVQTETGMKILDQHALAERVIYEKLINSKYSFSTQGLLIGESINLTSKELDILETNKQVFEEMGFEFEILSSGIVMINAIPDFVKKEDLSKIFTGIINDIGDYSFNKSNTLEEVKNKIFSYASCRVAIKFGNKLSLFEMNKLLNDSVLDYSSTCPHGRPVVYEINLEDLQNKYER